MMLDQPRIQYNLSFLVVIGIGQECILSMLLFLGRIGNALPNMPRIRLFWLLSVMLDQPRIQYNLSFLVAIGIGQECILSMPLFLVLIDNALPSIPHIHLFWLR